MKRRKGLGDAPRAARNGSAALIEPLEERRLMSLTVEVRGVGGSAAATAGSGQVLNLQIVAVITGGVATGSNETDISSNDPSTFGLLDLTGSVISTGIYSNDVAGDLGSAAVTSEFSANGAANGTPQDLNGDGNLDVGGTDASQDAGYFQARGGSAEHNGTLSSTAMTFIVGTLNYTAMTFIVGTLNYTVTALNDGGETDINFVPRPSGIGYYSAVWDDGVSYGGYGPNDQTSTFEGGTPFVVTDAALNPAPVVNPLNLSTVRDTPLSVDALGANVTTSDALVSSSIATPPAHGTAVVQSDGSILYTPGSRYVGSDSFTYHVTDSNGKTSNDAAVTLTVTAPPPPVAVDDSATTLRNDPTTIDVLANDSDPLTGTITPSLVAVVTAPSDGTAAVQPDGTIIYTPATRFVGTDSFTYTDTDSLGDTSSPATVLVAVTPPIPPVANDDDFQNLTEGGATTLSVLTNDTVESAALDPMTVTIVSASAHGTAVPQADGTIVFTVDNLYIGADSFTYTVNDVLGDVSNPATVTLNINAASPPFAIGFTAPVVFTPVIPIDVLDHSSSVTTIFPSSVTIYSDPAHGTAVVDQTTGAIAYTPNSGFVGTDTFTYTVSDANDLTSSPGTVTINDGVQLSSNKGGIRSVRIVDSAGGTQIVSLNQGIAELAFSGSGAVSTTRGGRMTITGSNLEITNLDLTDTSKASSLVVRGVGKSSTDIGEISDASPMGRITAPSATVNDNIDLAGISSLTIAGIFNAGEDAAITIGNGGAASANLSLGVVGAGTTISSSVAIGSLKVTSWQYGLFLLPFIVAQGGSPATEPAIVAPSIGRIISTGDFGANLTLSSTQPSGDLASVRVGGQLRGTWTVASPAGTVSAGSVDPGWSGTSGGFKSFIVRGGGFAGTLSGLSGSMVVHGDLTGTVTGVSAKSIRVTGSISGATVDLTGVFNDAGYVNASLGRLTAGSLVNSNVYVGVPTSIALGDATDANLGTGIIQQIQLTGRYGDQFSNSSVLAGTIRSISLGSVSTDNTGAAEGIAASTIRSASGVFGADVIHLGPRQLGSEALLQSYLTQQSIAFGDFEIAIPVN